MAGILFTLAGCDQEEVLTGEDIVEISKTIENEKDASQEADFVAGLGDIGMEDNQQKTGEVQERALRYRYIPDDAEVTFTNDANGDLVTGDYELVIDFGTDGIECYDGRVRKGIITVTSNGYYRDEGTVINTTTENYAVSRDGINYNQHTFSRTVTNNGTNDNGNIEFSVVESDVVVLSDGQVVNWNSNRTREWDWGTDGTRFTADDYYYISGSGTTERVGVRTVDHVINSALVFKFDCGVVYGGVLTHTDRETGNNIVVDFGSGCTIAKTVTYNINGRSFTFFL